MRKATGRCSQTEETCLINSLHGSMRESYPGYRKPNGFSVFYFEDLRMNLKKNLKMKRNKGQASLEYFLILLCIATLTIISFSSFLPSVISAFQGPGGIFPTSWSAITQ